MRAHFFAAGILLAIILFSAACTKSAQTTTVETSSPAAAESPTVAPVQSPTTGATTAAAATPAPSPTVRVSFADIKGNFAEKAIIAEAQLGVFDAAFEAFKPDAPIKRSEFIKWLVRANNAYYADTPDEQIRPASGGPSYFVDVSSSDANYRYIQAMANAGFVIGIDAKHVAPDRNLTREEMIAIKVGRDLKGNPYKNSGIGDVRVAYPFADLEKINKRYYDAFYGDYFDGSKNIPRVFGAVKTFQPQRPVTRAEAALCLDEIGNYRPRTAEQVASPTPTP